MRNRLWMPALTLCLGLVACEVPDPTSQENAVAVDDSDSQAMVSRATERVLTDLQGNDRRIADWRGKVVLVNFWATWCAPCLRELPALSEARRKYGDQGFEVLGIAIDQREPVLRFVAEQQIEFPILDGENGGMQMLSSLGNERGGLPFSVMFDREGRIRLRHLGELTHDQIKEEIEKLL